MIVDMALPRSCADGPGLTLWLKALQPMEDGPNAEKFWV